MTFNGIFFLRKKVEKEIDMIKIELDFYFYIDMIKIEIEIEKEINNGYE